MTRPVRSVGSTFDPKRNGLNLLRLVLATGVLLRHSFTMLGVPVGWHPIDNVLLSVFVDGFFAISGFLIVRSWDTRPDAGRFLRARCARILPGFWVCLIVTAFLAAPLHALLYGESTAPPFFSDAFGYVWHNWLLWIFQVGIDGGPRGASLAETGTWNGSLWTLSWEFICYLGVLGLGLLGLMRRRAVVAGLFVGALIVLVLTGTVIDSYLIHHAARFATMFLAGAVLYTFRFDIPARGWALLPCAAIVLFAGSLFDYRVVAALPLAYLCVVGGSLITVPAARLSHDLSYGVYIYGYPVQQLLVGGGLRALGVPWFFVVSVVCVMPVAAASWFGVERPAQRLNRWWEARRTSRPAAVETSTPAGTRS